jgi:hypothetical protein
VPKALDQPFDIDAISPKAASTVIACDIRDSRFEVRGDPQYCDPFGVQP